jgi:hypothetical protein
MAKVIEQLSDVPMVNQKQDLKVHEQLARGIRNEIDLMLANGQFDSFHKFINLLIPVLEKAQKRIRLESESNGEDYQWQ